MSTLRTMADLLSRHASRAALAQIAPARPRRATPGQGALTLNTDPPPPPRTKALPITRVERGDGYDLVVGKTRAVGVQPTASGWAVKNVGAECTAKLDDARAAHALAWRIARMSAARMRDDE